MKIIAIIPKRFDPDFVCQISADDLAKLLGHSYYSSLPGKGKLEIGDTVKVAEMFDRLREIKSLETELEKAAALLRASADLLEKALPAVHRANSVEKAKIERWLRNDDPRSL